MVFFSRWKLDHFPNFSHMYLQFYNISPIISGPQDPCNIHLTLETLEIVANLENGTFVHLNDFNDRSQSSTFHVPRTAVLGLWA